MPPSFNTVTLTYLAAHGKGFRVAVTLLLLIVCCGLLSHDKEFLCRVPMGTRLFPNSHSEGDYRPAARLTSTVTRVKAMGLGLRAHLYLHAPCVRLCYWPQMRHWTHISARLITYPVISKLRFV